MDEMDEWESRQIDHVLAFYQPPIDIDFYIHLPALFYVDGKDKNESYSLQFENNLYVTRQAEVNLVVKLQPGLEDVGFKQIKVYPSLFC